MQMFCLCFFGGQGETGVAGLKSFPNKICNTGIFKRHFGSMSGPPDTHRMNGGWGLLLVQSWFEVTFLAMVTECPVGPRFQASPLEPRRPCPAPGLQVTDAQGSGESCPAFCPLCPSLTPEAWASPHISLRACVLRCKDNQSAHLPRTCKRICTGQSEKLAAQAA